MKWVLGSNWVWCCYSYLNPLHLYCLLDLTVVLRDWHWEAGSELVQEWVLKYPAVWLLCHEMENYDIKIYFQYSSSNTFLVSWVSWTKAFWPYVYSSFYIIGHILPSSSIFIPTYSISLSIHLDSIQTQFYLCIQLCS